MPVKQDTFEGVDVINNNDAANHILGYNDTVVLDGSAGDAEAATITNCRYISVDGNGIIKIRYANYVGNYVIEVKNLLAGHLYPIRNVNKLFQYYTGSTPGTATAYGEDGVSITNAVKLHR